ncbi:unnamed protein product [Rhizophagus irregularis]|nr:unnamed protein product [Rhizophagus irregularis]CAB4414557.1 unnamed protein product [Rhizophagus irregularis]
MKGSPVKVDGATMPGKFDYFYLRLERKKSRSGISMAITVFLFFAVLSCVILLSLSLNKNIITHLKAVWGNVDENTGKERSERDIKRAISVNSWRNFTKMIETGS